MFAALDFNVRIEALALFATSADSQRGLGGGLVEFRSCGCLGIEGNLSVAVNRNYYEELIEPPITDVLTAQLRLVLGFPQMP